MSSLADYPEKKRELPAMQNLAFICKDYNTVELDLETTLEGAGYMIRQRLREEQVGGGSCAVWVGAEVCLTYTTLQEGRAYVQIVSGNKEKFETFTFRMCLLFDELESLPKLEKLENL